MTRSKYILIMVEGCETPIVFPVWCKHSDIARALVGADGEVLSAGFVEFYADGGNAHVETLGESTSLKLAPGGNDAQLIARALGFAE